MKSSLILATLLLAAGCNQSPTPASPSRCTIVAAQYTGTFRDSCGLSSTSNVTLFQLSGCRFYGELPGIGTIQGTIDGAFLVLTVAFSPCGGSASGSAQMNSHGDLAGSYNGTETGAGCCANVSGSFTLMRQ